MYIKRALIFSRVQKTDDELKAIMATHPWAGTLMHGFYKSREGKWDPYFFQAHTDAIWIDEGITAFCRSNNEWIDEEVHSPAPLFWHVLDRPWEERRDIWRNLEKAWWSATTALVLHSIPKGYPAYVVYYGEIEDEFDNAEEVWRESILEHFDYSDEVKAAIAVEDNAMEKQMARDKQALRERMQLWGLDAVTLHTASPQPSDNKAAAAIKAYGEMLAKKHCG
jgi:hypothetical protein